MNQRRKASPAARTDRKRSQPQPAQGPPWKLIAFLTVLSGMAVLFFWRSGNLLWYGDAASHLNIARRIIDGRNAGYEQIGRIWLPLPHLLMAPFAAVDSLWQSGLAGAIPNALCFIGAGLFLYGAANRTYGCAQAGVAAALLFALNPNMLYLQAVPMTESILAFGLLGALYGMVRGSAALTGMMLMLATLTRYEAWFLIPFVFGYFWWREGLWKAVVVGALASLGPVYWVGHNYALYSDPLDFYHGDGSAKWHYQQALQKGLPLAPGDGDWYTATKYYAMAGRLFAGIPLLALAGAGAVIAILRRAWWPIFFLLLGPLFYVWSMHGSGATIFVPNLYPFSYYNTRYGMAALPLAALAAAAIVGFVPERARKLALIGVVLTGMSPWIFYPKRDGWVTWKESEVNSIARREWTERTADYLKERYVPGRGIVAHFGDQTGIFQQAGIPIRETVHDGDGIQFQAIQKRPDLFLWQEWVVARADDELGRAMAANAGKLPRYRRVNIVNVKGASPVEIWRRTPPATAP